MTDMSKRRRNHRKPSLKNNDDQKKLSYFSEKPKQMTLTGDTKKYVFTQCVSYCQKCGKTQSQLDGQLEYHHITYVPEKQVRLCTKCHASVDGTPLAAKQSLADLFVPASEIPASETSKDIPDHAYIAVKNGSPAKTTSFNWQWEYRDDDKGRDSYHICSMNNRHSCKFYIGPDE
jgi:hypothetical protein